MASKEIFWKHRELLWMLTVRNLRIRYKSSFLGFVWSLLTPLLMILIYAIFARILRFNTGSPHYLQFLIVGIIVWQFLSTCVNDSLHSIAGHSNLIKKVYFPRVILPVSMVTANAINYLLMLAVLMVYLLLCGMSFTALWMLPGIIVVHSALCLGLSFLIGTANVYFRDTQHILGVGMLAWFFLTPIFYPLSFQTQQMPSDMQWALFLNPMTGIVSAYRMMLIPGETLWATGWMVSSIVACAIFMVGGLVFRASESHFADEL